MPLPNSIDQDPQPAKPLSARAAAMRAAKAGQTPFLGMLNAVLVDDPVDFEFDGAISRTHAFSIWTWMIRDVAPDLITAAAIEAGTVTPADLDAVLPEILTRVRAAVAAASKDQQQPDQRFRAQLGGDEAWARLPIILNAIKCRTLLEKAMAFGRATNGITDDAALSTALQSMPLQDASVSALLMQAAIGQIVNPGKLIIAVIRIAGNATEAAIGRAGFAPLVDAILSHAQNQIHALQPTGAFADIDLTCRSVDRFHRLMRAVSGYVEISRLSRWSMIISSLTKAVSERIEPKLREVAPDVNQSLRRPREGNDRIDSDRLLSALNGVYLLTTVRDCRDSLALNALFDQVWTQTAQALELHLTRNLDVLRANPGDKIAAERLDAGIKMAELRFNAEYADVLRRARDAAVRRLQ
jgi:hypothetical protein